MVSAVEDGGEQTTPTSTVTTAKIPKVQVTRTALHVARSLDPDSTETVNVRTRTGDIATLIVRKRGGKSNPALPPPVAVRSTSINILDEEKRESKSENLTALNVPAPVTVSSSAFFTGDGDHQRSGKSTEDVINIVAPPKDLSPPSSSLEELVRVHDNENEREKKAINVPPPVYIRSSPMSIKGEQNRPENFWKRGRSVMHIDSDGIPVIHGIRMPDDESDRQTWRNARVIDGILVPYDKPVNKVDSGDKQEITRKATVHIQDPTTMKKTAEDSSPIKPSPYLEHTVKKNQYNYPYVSDTHDRILEYINTVNQRETDRRRNVPSKGRMIRFPAFRRSDDVQDEIGNGESDSGSELQARVLHYPGSPIYPTSLLYTPPSAKISRVSFEEGVRTPVLQYAHPELGVQPAKVIRKQDEVEEVDESKQDHKRSDGGKANALTLAYFAQDIHSDRSPYAYEPGMETKEDQAQVATTDPSAYGKRSSSGEEDFSSESSSKPWPKSSLAYLHEQQTSDDTYGLGNDKYIKRYPYNGYNTVYSGSSKDTQNRYKGPIAGSGYSRYPFGSGHYTIHAHTNQERPFWERIGDTIREHVQTSMEKVSDITRPVVEPLVEATHKISYNLGFASEGNRNVIQDKVGSTVAAYPVLLPALGLVAGGAALGLGAVAVGRYLDVDVMKRRTGLREDDSEDLEVEHKRALESIMKNLRERESARQGGTWTVNDDSTKVDEGKMVGNIIRSLKNPREVAGEGTWVLIRNVKPTENERVQQVVGQRGVWSGSDDSKNQDDEEKKAIQSIVGTLAEQEGIGHQEGSWIVTEESSQEGNQQRKEGRWVVDKNGITQNERQVKTKRSLNDGVIFVVEEDPDIQSSQQMSVQKMIESNKHFRRERDLNQEILAKIGQHLADGSLSNFDIIEDDESHRYKHRMVKRSTQDSTMSGDTAMDQSLFHVKRSSEDFHQTDNKEEAIMRPEDGERYLDNILHSLESSQQEILANMARLDDHRGDWSNTPCAKKIFCDVMVKQPADALMLMEKKMATFLSL
jgi:hypothetical protein